MSRRFMYDLCFKDGCTELYCQSKIVINVILDQKNVIASCNHIFSGHLFFFKIPFKSNDRRKPISLFLSAELP